MTDSNFQREMLIQAYDPAFPDYNHFLQKNNRKQRVVNKEFVNTADEIPVTIQEQEAMEQDTGEPSLNLSGTKIKNSAKRGLKKQTKGKKDDTKKHLLIKEKVNKFIAERKKQHGSQHKQVKEKIETEVLHSLFYPIPIRAKNITILKRANIIFSLCNHCQMRSQAKVPIINGFNGSAYLTIVLCQNCIDINSRNGNLRLNN